MYRSVAIRLFLFLLVVSLAGMTGCKNFFVPICTETNTCPTSTGAPTITSISPANGASGTAVTLTGTNFTGATAVNFGGTAGTSLSVVSATQITVDAPAGSGTVSVTVTNASGTSNGESFTYGSAPAATSSNIYVANTTAGTIAGFSLNSGKLYILPGSPYALGQAPTAIAASPTGSLLYMATAADLYVYAIGSNGALTLGASGQPVASVSLPTDMVIDKTGNWLFIVSSTAAALYEYQIDPNTGTLTAMQGSPLTLSGNPTQVYLTPNNQNVYIGESANTSGTSTVGGIDVYSLDASTGAIGNHLHLAARTALSSDNALGSDSNSKFLFVGETASGIRVFNIGSGGSLSEVSGSPFTTGFQNDPAAIAVDPTNKYVYVASHISNLITGYSFNSSGALTELSSSPFSGAGTSPIAMSLDGSGTYMAVAASGDYPDLEIFSFDTTTPGKLDAMGNTATGQDPTVPISMAVTK